jgi:hypothetical protein
MKVLSEWLTQRVENAPIAQHRNLSPMASMRIRMAWQKLKDEAREGDELWAFENPPTRGRGWVSIPGTLSYAMERS